MPPKLSDAARKKSEQARRSKDRETALQATAARAEEARANPGAGPSTSLPMAGPSGDGSAWIACAPLGRLLRCIVSPLELEGYLSAVELEEQAFHRSTARKKPEQARRLKNEETTNHETGRSQGRG